VPSTFCGRQAKKTKAADSFESTAYMFFVVVMGGIEPPTCGL